MSALIIALFCLFYVVSNAQIIQHGAQYQKSLGDSSETIAAGGNVYNNMTGFIFPNAGLLGTFLVYNDTILPKRFSFVEYDSALHQWFPRVLTGGITVNDTGFVTVTGSGTPTGTAGGDLSGNNTLTSTYPAPYVTNLDWRDTIINVTATLPSTNDFWAGYVRTGSTLTASDTITLPQLGSVLNYPHKLYYIEKEDSTTHFVYVKPQGTDSITYNGATGTAGVKLANEHDFILLVPSMKNDAFPRTWNVIASRVVGLSGNATPGGTAGGDLSGTYPNPTVAKINGATLGTTTATSGNILIGSGSAWVTNAVTGDVSMTSTGITQVGGIQSHTVSLTGILTGQFLQYNSGNFINASQGTWYSPGAQVSQAQNTNEKVSFTNTHFYGAFPGAAGDGQETLAPAAGHITYFTVNTAAAPAVGQHFVFTIFINGVATAAQITLANPNTTGNTGAVSIAFAKDDRLSIEISTSATSGALASWDGGISCVFP